ncbi:prepilin peptidase [Qipengyuania xiapuensis]|uniref:Prepilin peptidase n=1 Tax=Qipengyuania xiapuensis TaxID=2867236 RepID=A0ABX8ZVG1_9SPHN|nr:prepilin peptidase [Qipengyuania xiapuensis]QZD91814.1 prepilin peptidase [Qipengyuania xiapuensis]
MAVATIWLAALSVTSGLGALLDVVTRKLPNWLSLLMLVGGLGFGFALDGWTGLGLHFLHAVLALGLGYLLFIWGVFGGGDGKFYAACAAFFPVTQMLWHFVIITFAGLILAIIWFTAKRGFGLHKRKKDDFAKLPYGVAIASGSVALALYGMQ